MSQKEVIFTHLLVEVYKFFIKDKIDHVPESVNFVDLAIKLCVQEISVLKNLEKTQADTVSSADHFLLQPTATVRTFMMDFLVKYVFCSFLFLPYLLRKCVDLVKLMFFHALSNENMIFLISWNSLRRQEIFQFFSFQYIKANCKFGYEHEMINIWIQAIFSHGNSRVHYLW